MDVPLIYVVADLVSVAPQTPTAARGAEKVLVDHRLVVVVPCRVW